MEITASLEELHGTVGGRIEVLYPFEDESGVICGDESKYDGSLPNRLLEDYNVIFGNFLTCGLSASDFDSLSDKMAETHRTMKTILCILSAEKIFADQVNRRAAPSVVATVHNRDSIRRIIRLVRVECFTECIRSALETQCCVHRLSCCVFAETVRPVNKNGIIIICYESSV